MNDEAWLTDYVLGEQTVTERVLAEARLAADPDLRRRAEELREVSARLHALPAAGWSDFESEPELAAPVKRTRRLRLGRRIGTRAGVARATAAFAVGVAVGAVVVASPADSPTSSGRVVALSALPGGPAAAHGQAVLAGDGRLRLTVTGLPRTPRGVFYEAWLMTDARRLVALATFRVMAGGRATVQIVLPAALGAYRYVDVSRQDVDSGPAHSADSVLRGPTRAA